MNLEIGGNITAGNRFTINSENTQDCEEHQNIILNPLGEFITLGQQSGNTNTNTTNKVPEHEGTQH